MDERRMRLTRLLLQIIIAIIAMIAFLWFILTCIVIYSLIQRGGQYEHSLKGELSPWLIHQTQTAQAAISPTITPTPTITLTTTPLPTFTASPIPTYIDYSLLQIHDLSGRFAFSPDGDRFALLRSDEIHMARVSETGLHFEQVIKIPDVLTEYPIDSPLPENLHRLSGVAFSPDSETLFIGSIRGTQQTSILRWDVATGEQLAMWTDGQEQNLYPISAPVGLVVGDNAVHLLMRRGNSCGRLHAPINTWLLEDMMPDEADTIQPTLASGGLPDNVDIQNRYIGDMAYTNGVYVVQKFGSGCGNREDIVIYTTDGVLHTISQADWGGRQEGLRYMALSSNRHYLAGTAFLNFPPISPIPPNNPIEVWQWHEFGLRVWENGSLVIEKTETDTYSDLAFTPDNQSLYVVTASEIARKFESLFEITWQVEIDHYSLQTFQHLHTLIVPIQGVLSSGHELMNSQLEISPNGKLMVLRMDGKLLVWSLPSS